MKKAISFVLAMVMTVSMFSVLAVSFSAVDTSGGFTYTELEDGGIRILDYSGTEANVIFPDEINGKPVVEIGDNCMNHNSTLVELTLPAHVRSIGVSDVYKRQS